MRRLVAAIGLGLFLGGPPAHAQERNKYALLIGIGDYLYDVQQLEGPPHDIEALKRVLLERWGFKPDNVKVILNGAATKAAILAALDELPVRTRPGDFVFVYFSGHGTSSYESKDLGLDNNTGALIPADVKTTAPNVRDSLVVGNRDVRPRLEKIDGDREVLVVFDSCYSADAVRSLRARGARRYVELPRTRSLAGFSESDSGSFGSQTQKAAPYPYRSVVYISAAAKSEAAGDVSRSVIARGEFVTVDGQPHGALSNYLIEALSGAGDSNGDGTVTYAELYAFLRNKVSESFPQQPQLSAPEAQKEAVLSKAIMAGAPKPQVVAAPPPPPASGLRVRLEGVAPALADQIRATSGLALVQDRNYDVLVAQDREGFKLFHGSGDVLASFGAQETEAVKERLRRQAAVQALLDFKFTPQDFNVSVSIPGNRGVLRRGEPFTIDVSSEQRSTLLLLDVDPSGYVGVLFPFKEAELAPTASIRVPPPPDELKVSPPLGTEYLKLFAFRERPAGIERWLKASFPASDPKLQELLDWLKGTRGSRASDRLKVVTREPGP